MASPQESDRIVLVNQRDFEPKRGQPIRQTLRGVNPFQDPDQEPSAYPYRTLETPNKIRLLKLAPFVSGFSLIEDICGVLIEVDVTDAPSYDCLSYVWGTSSPDAYIWLGQHRFPVSENLWTALRCLQSEDKFRLVWIDFICINQDDLDEREAQVRIMYDIYQGAKQVLAYLGPEADGSEDIPDFINEILMAILNRRLQGRFDDPGSQYTSLGQSGLPGLEDKRWEAFRKFLQRPWFTRVWIIQEAVSAKKLYMMFGGWTVNSASFFTVVQLGYLFNLPFLPQRSEATQPSEEATLRGMRQILLMRELGVLKDESLGIKFFHPRFENASTASILMGQDFVDTMNVCQQWRPSLLFILEMSRHSQSKDPRDRVFAFLNLSKERGERDLQPDYRATVRDTYAKAGRFFVRAGQGPRLISQAGLSDSTLELPSWIPDWSLTDLPPETIAPRESVIYPPSSTPHAGGEYEDGDFVLDGENSLKVKAYIIGQISSLGKVHRFQTDPDAKTVSEGHVTDMRGSSVIGEDELLRYFGFPYQPPMVIMTDNEATSSDFPVLSRYISESPI
jgi:hypothetical protein